ncbi:hypothetical protein M472_14805 [Sphingobacterium paucimobilis HER1398]|uniref:Uncharacterized protein n=2 Tax=Sphingobacterium TaxID=28453 RepID=U2HWZ8_9SPHI|nr:hypothetical protein M472_14805 [Sphingobacterium paucimobilis HER1398]
MGCSKEKFLDEKPNQALLVPQTLEELQAILDNTALFNGIAGALTTTGITPLLGQTASDEYFVGRPTAYVSSSNTYMKATYTWDKKDVYAGYETIVDWTKPYNSILSANICLEQLSKLSMSDQNSLLGREVRGTALFHRAHLYFQLAQVFAPVYSKEYSSQKNGLPIRLRGDINEGVVRTTLSDTYVQILNDLLEALKYLPANALYTTRPNIAAAKALLARVYLSMSDYPQALIYANKALEIKSKLMDYNSLDLTKAFPIHKDNDEVIFSSLMIVGGVVNTAFSPSYASVDSNIVNSYENGDLRKSVFLKKRTPANSIGMEFKGSYFGDSYCFSGLATDELYLIKAECLARSGRTEDACVALNTLLKNRFDPLKFDPLDERDPDKLLKIVLDERRKELLFRGLRWTDLRRLNLDPRFAVTLKRNIGEEEFELPPNDVRYTYPIPADVMGFHPEMFQNPR